MSRAFKKKGKKGWKGVLEIFPSVKRVCAVSCPHLFLLRQKLDTQISQLFLAAVAKSREGGTSGHKKRNKAEFWGGEGCGCGWGAREI